MNTIQQVYVKALSAGEWLGAWAPILARLEWLRTDRKVALFTLVDPNLDEDDEYEFYELDSQVMAVLEEGIYKVVTGVYEVLE